jgi:hypothetical protein
VIFRTTLSIIFSSISLSLTYFTLTYLLNLTSTLATTPVYITLGSLEVDLTTLSFNLLPYLVVFGIVSRLIPTLLSLLLSSGFSNAFFYDH